MCFYQKIFYSIILEEKRHIQIYLLQRANLVKYCQKLINAVQQRLISEQKLRSQPDQRLWELGESLELRTQSEFKYLQTHLQLHPYTITYTYTHSNIPNASLPYCSATSGLPTYIHSYQQIHFHICHRRALTAKAIGWFVVIVLNLSPLFNPQVKKTKPPTTNAK